MEWKDFKFEIVDMDAQRIDKVLVTETPVAKEPA
jgi:CBS domain containing-hemolysin-like protein